MIKPWVRPVLGLLLLVALASSALAESSLSNFQEAFSKGNACVSLQTHLQKAGFVEKSNLDGKCRDGTKAALDRYLGSVGLVDGPAFEPASNYVDRLLVAVEKASSQTNPEIPTQPEESAENTLELRDQNVAEQRQPSDRPTEPENTGGPAQAPPMDEPEKKAPVDPSPVTEPTIKAPKPEDISTQDGRSAFGEFLSGFTLSDVLALMAALASVVGLMLRERRNISREISRKIDDALATQGKDKERFDQEIARIKSILDERVEELDDQIRENRRASKEHASNVQSFEDRMAVVSEKLDMIRTRDTIEDQVEELKVGMTKASTTFKELVNETHEQITQAMQKADEANSRVESLREEIANVVKLPNTA
ncbi:MAG: hypothetical protein ACWA44_16040 [Thiotrichales bacterium]